MPKRSSATEQRFAEFIRNSNLIESVAEPNLRTLLTQIQNLRERKTERTHVGEFALIYEIAEKQQSLTLKDLLKIQAGITSEQLVLGHPIATKYIGTIRDCPVRIGFGIIPPPSVASVKSFLRAFNHATKKITRANLFTTLSEQHLLFERLHPFADGNGRTGRLLLAYQFLFARAGGKISRTLRLPIVLNRRKENYYSTLNLFEHGEKALGIEKFAELLRVSCKS